MPYPALYEEIRANPELFALTFVQECASVVPLNAVRVVGRRRTLLVHHGQNEWHIYLMPYVLEGKTPKLAWLNSRRPYIWRVTVVEVQGSFECREVDKT